MNGILREYTRGQLILLADASRLMYESVDKDKPDDAPAPQRDTAVDRWIETVDTTKMTLKEYKQFLALQQSPGESE